MNIGLVRRSLTETFLTTLTFAAIIGGVSMMLARILPNVQERFLSRPNIPPQVLAIRNALMGIDGMTSSVSDFAFGLAWSHPIALALLFAHAIIYTTRVPAGELERGTIDVLLGLPVSRWSLYISETIAWIISGAFVLGAMYLGSWLGAQFIKEANRPDFAKLAMVLTNLSLVYFVAGAIGLLTSSLSNRRGRAVLVVLVFVVASTLIFLLRGLWEPARTFGWLSMLHYYKPVEILQKGKLPLRDVIVLGSSLVVLWATAGVVLRMRALTTT